MGTIADFKARLARMRGVNENRVTGRRVGDWLKLEDGKTRVTLGLRVYWLDDRHAGRIEKIWHSAYATIRWESTGWITEGVKISELRVAPKED